MNDTLPIGTEEQPWSGREIEGKYRVGRMLGRGGMGAVYEAENLALGKRVALKFLDAQAAQDTDGVQRFMREARAASTIESAHIVQVFDVGEVDDGRPYLVMELLRGETLSARLQREGRLSPTETVHLAVQMLRGLHRAHEHGIVHRDLKPENVFLVETDGDPVFVKIVDFGISKITRRSGKLEPGSITREGVVLGTPFYMAPEQAQALADLDERADLWSVGAILYECLSGHRPFAGETYEQVIISICTSRPDELASAAQSVPRALSDVIMQALRRDRSKRFESAKAFLSALQVATPDLVGAVPPSFDPSSRARAKPLPEARRGPGTDATWSSAGSAAAEPDSGASPQRMGRKGKLALVGITTALVAFALTFGIAAGLRSSEAPAVDSQPPPAPQPPEAGSVHIETNAPAAVIEVEGEPIDDATLRGLPGEQRRIRVAAPGFRPHEDTVRISEGVRVVRIALRPAPSAAPPTSSGKVAAPAPRPPPRGSGHRGSPESPESGSLTGGLELKTDLP